jgi:hypothetical protein
MSPRRGFLSHGCCFSRAQDGTQALTLLSADAIEEDETFRVSHGPRSPTTGARCEAGSRAWPRFRTSLIMQVSDRVLNRDAHSAESLVAALEGRIVHGAHGTWTVAVYGVHLGSDELWLQVGLRSDKEHNLVLHLSRDATVDDALAALRECDPETHCVFVLECGAGGSGNDRRGAAA